MGHEDTDEQAKRRARAEEDLRVSLERQLAAMPKGRPVPTTIGRHIVGRDVDNPMLTDGLAYSEQRNAHLKVKVEENAATRLGGLALIRRKLNHHEKAAEWFKNAYEALYGGLAPAIDMAKVRVDTSIMAHDNGAVARLDKGKTLQTIMDELGKPASDRVIACVVLGIPCADSAIPGLSGKPSGHAVQREVDLLLEALDLVAELRGYKTREAA